MAKKKTKSSVGGDGGGRSFTQSSFSLTPSVATAISIFALLVRSLVSIGPYSGQGSPPKYGDYEAQRHWMEIALHTPPREWYRNTTDNDLSYWGLDYPPLSAYQSLAHALLINHSDPGSLSLLHSRGFESPSSKRVMRWTVLSSDLLVFFPAAIYFVVASCRRGSGGVAAVEEDRGSSPWLLAMILLNPCLILIDHGHFQYNCISLGFVLGAVASMLSGKELFASMLFTLSINHKQMSMYFAPAFFSHLLGKCLRRRNPVLEVMKLGIVVIGTFALVWWPYLYSVESVLEVLARLAPFERGIFEDYVANFWCSTSVFIKWKRLFTIRSLKIISLTSTIAVFLPSFVQQIKSPSNLGFLYALLNSSLSFYLLSYQVHEKSILLPLLPASLLARREPFVLGWLTYYALLSMFPLLCRDQLVLQYAALLLLFGLLFFFPSDRSDKKSKQNVSIRVRAFLLLVLCCSSGLHLVYLKLKPPERYPFLFEAIIMFFCFSQFVLLTIYCNVKQWSLGPSAAMAAAATILEKKHV